MRKWAATSRFWIYIASQKLARHLQQKTQSLASSEIVSGSCFPTLGKNNLSCAMSSLFVIVGTSWTFFSSLDCFCWTSECYRRVDPGSLFFSFLPEDSHGLQGQGRCVHHFASSNPGDLQRPKHARQIELTTQHRPT